MLQLPVYLDHHATTPVDPRVLEAMLPYFGERFGNAGSSTHSFGWEARDAVAAARETIARRLGAAPTEIVFTSGATESNNLALRGVAEHARRRGNHIVSVRTEHKAVLDPLEHLRRKGFEVTLLEVEPAGCPRAGWLDPQRVAEALRGETCVVSVMLANNEIGVVQSLAEIGQVCRERGVPLHTDATQAIGKIPVDFGSLPVDLASFSAHKLYGPKGVGGLFVRRRGARVRLEPQIDGGGQEQGLRSGTLNVPGIVGLAKGVEIATDDLPTEMARLRELRERLWRGICGGVPDAVLNGPRFDPPEWRLAGNLNAAFPLVQGEALILEMKDLAVSSGSACTSAMPTPSHVLSALGLDEDLVRASVRFGLGRGTDEEQIEFAIERIGEAVGRLRALSG